MVIFREHGNVGEVRHLTGERAARDGGVTGDEIGMCGDRLHAVHDKIRAVLAGRLHRHLVEPLGPGLHGIAGIRDQRDALDTLRMPHGVCVESGARCKHLAHAIRWIGG